MRNNFLIHPYHSLSSSSQAKNFGVSNTSNRTEEQKNITTPTIPATPLPPPSVTTANSSYYTDIILGDFSNDLLLPTTQRHLTSEEEIQNLTCDSIPNLQFCRDQRRSQPGPFQRFGFIQNFRKEKQENNSTHT